MSYYARVLIALSEGVKDCRYYLRSNAKKDCGINLQT